MDGYGYHNLAFHPATGEALRKKTLKILHWGLNMSENLEIRIKLSHWYWRLITLGGERLSCHQHLGFELPWKAYTSKQLE